MTSSPTTDTALFSSLGLSAPLLKAIANAGYTTPTPIQVQAIPPILTGRDILGCAQTGTGKTAAFALPILHRLSAQPAAKPNTIRALVLAPTRELALQIQESFVKYGQGIRLRSVVIFGGVSQEHQVRRLRSGVDILVATPGRLLDLIQQKFIRLDGIETFVLDEADRMLDMGFLPDIRRVLRLLPEKRQTLLLSATMLPEIRKLAEQMLKNPASVQVGTVSAAAPAINQAVYMVAKQHKRNLLAHLLTQEDIKRVLVFTRTKFDADKLVGFLAKKRIASDAIHGRKSQGARQRALQHFKAGQTRVLVATDICARGIDVHEVTHVINLDVPEAPENYVHRIGRTARAGASGIAFSFCSPEERNNLKRIEKLIRKNLPVLTQHPFA